jgi:hypothetical protein
VLVCYDEKTGFWRTNPDCFRLPDYLKDRNASVDARRAADALKTVTPARRHTKDT